MKRLFFALWPNAETRKQISNFNHSINVDGLKKVKVDNLHVTLVFLGNVDAETEVLIRQAVDDIKLKPFVIPFDRLLFWQKPRVLCLSTEHYDSQLSILVNALTCRVEQFGINSDDRPYKPHVTLARKAHKLIDFDVLPIVWEADSFCLVESLSIPGDVHYQVLQRWGFE